MKMKLWKLERDHRWKSTNIFRTNKSSRIPAMEVQTLSWQLKEAQDIGAYPLQQSSGETQQSSRHQGDLSEKQKIVGDKDHAPKAYDEEAETNLVDSGSCGLHHKRCFG